MKEILPVKNPIEKSSTHNNINLLSHMPSMGSKKDDKFVHTGNRRLHHLTKRAGVANADLIVPSNKQATTPHSMTRKIFSRGNTIVLGGGSGARNKIVTDNTLKL